MQLRLNFAAQSRPVNVGTDQTAAPATTPKGVGRRRQVRRALQRLAVTQIDRSRRIGGVGGEMAKRGARALI